MAHLVPWILALVCCLDYCYGQDYPEHQAAESMPAFYRKYPGTHVAGGIPQTVLRSEGACLSACQSDPHCVAVDFNHLAKLCFFHGKETACGHQMYKHGCTHYAMTNHCTTTIKRYSVVELEVDSEYDEVYVEIKVDSYHGKGAIFQYGDGHLAACVADCKNTSWCKGVDFSTYGNTCWFHSEQTVCNKLAYKYECTHVRIKDDCSAIEHEAEEYGTGEAGHGEQGHGVEPYGPEQGQVYEEGQGHSDDSTYEEGHYANGEGLVTPGEEPYAGLRPDQGEGPYDGQQPDYREEPYGSQNPDHGNGPYDRERPNHGTGPYDGEKAPHGEEPYDADKPHHGPEQNGHDNLPGRSPIRHVAYGVWYATGQGKPTHIRLLPLPDHVGGNKPQTHGKGPEYSPNPWVDQTHNIGFNPSPVGDHKPEHDKGYIPPHGQSHKPEHGDGYPAPQGQGHKPEHGDGYAPPHEEGYKPAHSDAHKPAHGNGYKPAQEDSYKPTHSDTHKPPHHPKPTPGYPHHMNPLFGLTSPAPTTIGYPIGGGTLPAGSLSPHGRPGTHSGRYLVGHQNPAGPSTGYQPGHDVSSSVDHGSYSSEQVPDYPVGAGPKGAGNSRYNQGQGTYPGNAGYNQQGSYPAEAGRHRYNAGQNAYKPVDAGQPRPNRRQPGYNQGQPSHYAQRRRGYA